MNTELKKYQLSAFLSPLLDEDQVKDIVAKIKKYIIGYEGATEQEKISKKRLGYQIKHFQDAFYVLIDFSLSPDKVIKLASKLKTESDILRHLITLVLKKKVHTKAKTKTPVKPAVLSPLKDKADVIDQVIEEKPIVEKETKTDKEAETKETTSKKEKVNIEDLDKKLDEILS